MRYSRRICRLTAVSALATCFLTTGTLHAQDYTRIPATYGPVSGQASSGAGITPTPSYNSVSSLPGAGSATVTPFPSTQPLPTYAPGHNNATARLQSAPAPVVPENPAIGIPENLAPAVPDEIPIMDNSALVAPTAPITQSPAPISPTPASGALGGAAGSGNTAGLGSTAGYGNTAGLGNATGYGNTAGLGNANGYSRVENYPNGGSPVGYPATGSEFAQTGRGWTTTSRRRALSEPVSQKDGSYELCAGCIE